MICVEIVRASEVKVVVELSYNEALVLAHVLDRWCEPPQRHAIQLNDPGDIRLINDFCASLRHSYTVRCETSFRLHYKFLFICLAK